LTRFMYVIYNYEYCVYTRKKLLFWLCNLSYDSSLEIDDRGILRPQESTPKKYKNRVFKCKLCVWAYPNEYAEKGRKYNDSWKPQGLLRRAEVCENMGK